MNKRHLKPWRFIYFGCIPKLIRKKIEKKFDKEIQLQVYKSWETCIDLYCDKKLEKFEILPKKELRNKKIIWQYWAQGFDLNTPEIVQLCRKSVEKYKGQYEVILIDDTNIQEYLTLPAFVWEKRTLKQFKHAFFADLIRLALLYAYGGIWLDATILLTSPIPNNILGKNFFMYQREKKSVQNQKIWQKLNSNYFSWEPDHYVRVLNSIILAEKEHREVQICLDLILNFWKSQNTIPHYFFFQIMFEVLKNKKLIEIDIVDDTKPHLMLNLLQKNEYNFESMCEIFQQTSIHKMTYFKKSKNIEKYYELILKNLN